MKKHLTDDELWGRADKHEIDVPEHKTLFGYDICQDCKAEIPRKEGLKTRCPKCGGILRNPV